MRILHAIPVYAPAWQFGGPVLSVSRLCEALVAEGLSVEVITTNAGLTTTQQPTLGQPVLLNGVNVTYYPVDADTGPIRSSALVQDLPNVLERVDLLHLSAIWQPLGIPIQQAAWKLGVPVLHSLRGALSPYSLSQRWWKKLPYFLLRERPSLQRAAALHVTSLQEQRELKPLRLKAPCRLLPNPMNLSKLQHDPDLGRAWRQQLGLEFDQPVFVICGRQHHKKGLDILPDVLGALRHKPWSLLLVGQDEDGSGASLLRQLTRRGLADRVTQQATVPADSLGGLYNAADLLLLPSRHENFGNVVIEAMACGCGVLISDKTGVASDLQRDAPSGFGAVLPRQTEAWIRWLEHWLEAPERPGRAAAQWTAVHYSQAAVAAQAIEIYREILQSEWS